MSGAEFYRTWPESRSWYEGRRWLSTTLVVLGGPGLLVFAGPDVGTLGVALGFGVSLAVAIGVLGAVANPMFSLALWLAKAITLKQAIGDWIGQLLGGILGAAAVSGECALLSSGPVVCWTGIANAAPAVVAGLGNVVRIAVGGPNCALASFRVFCWGAGIFGDGQGFEVRPVPSAVPGLDGVGGIATGAIPRPGRPAGAPAPGSAGESTAAPAQRGHARRVGGAKRQARFAGQDAALSATAIRG